MSLLDRISSPADLRKFDGEQLGALAEEVRQLLIGTVSRTGGHLGPNLGVVELTIALHRVFDSPRDRILFDTGHQAYVHKLLTGRAAEFHTLRQAGGLSGYPSRRESVHDIIENSHASTALSYADGFAKGHALQGESGRAVVAVVGDGALTGGMAWEALNNIGMAKDRPIIVVLNDNGRSYSPTVGGFAAHLAELRQGRQSGATIFESLGLGYLGPVDGHDLQAVETALCRARERCQPVVVHCITGKGRGYPPAEADQEDHLHSPGPFDPATGAQLRRTGASWTSVFSEELAALADARPDIVGITAAMLHPTGLARLAARHPHRVFDVGICEQHAVASAAGLAYSGLHPVVSVYATFLNRALDQVLMDVALHRLPVTFVLDRAGVTGDDGPSHNGMWDLSMLQVVPGLRIAAPRDGSSLRRLLGEATAISDGPTVLRFPKGPVGDDLPAVGRLGSMDVLECSAFDDVLLVACGALAGSCLAAGRLLSARGIYAAIVDPRWVRPLDPALASAATRYSLVAVAEDNVGVGGIGDAVARLLRDVGVQTPVLTLAIPQSFLAHGRRPDVLSEVGLSPDRMAKKIADRMVRFAAGPATRPSPAPLARRLAHDYQSN
jgi:1-deoxy-D-xylulose-5-phosphate synthase